MHVVVYTPSMVSTSTFKDATIIYGLSITGPTSTPRTTVTVTATPTPPSTTTTTTASTIPPDDEVEPTETDPDSPPPWGTDEHIHEDYEDWPNDGGLSTGAQVGIGAGAGVGVVGLVAGGFFLYRRHKMKPPPKTIREISGGPSEGELNAHSCLHHVPGMGHFG